MRVAKFDETDTCERKRQVPCREALYRHEAFVLGRFGGETRFEFFESLEALGLKLFC